MVSSEPTLAVEDNYFSNNMKEMIGGCCVCSDERGWAENPLVYCDGHGCNVAVHQAYSVTGPVLPVVALQKQHKWYTAFQRCELCPHKDGALKRTDNGGWAHVVCALYIPEVEFANVSTMEPIVLQSVPHDRYNKTCYICEEQGRESKAATGACMTCNKHGCRQAFHVTCAQFAGLLCEEEGSDADNVKYCGYCKNHYSKLRRSKRGSSSAYDQSLSDSSSHSLDKHHDKDKKSYTSTSGGGSSMPGSLKRLEETTARFTNANFQEVPAHPTSGKDGSAEVKVGGEGKGKKALGHSTGQKGRKPGAGRTPVGVTVTAATSTSPFQQGAGSHLGTAGSAKTSSGSSVQSPQEFLSFTESDLRNDSYTHSQQSSYTRGLSKGDAAGLEGGLNTFSSLMALPSASSGAAQAKNYENSHRDFSSSACQASAGYKRSQPTSGSVEEDNVKGKKRKGNRSKYGAGRSRGNKAQEAVSSASPASSVASAAGSVNGVNYNNNGSNNISIVQKSPTLLRNGSFHNVSVSSSPAGTGPFAGNDTPVSLPNAVLGSHCSTPIPSSQLPQQSAVHLQHTVPSLPPHTTASVPNLVCATQGLAEAFRIVVSTMNEHELLDRLSILGMLKSLHQLQMENRRLEEQIRILTAKKERLQLLSAQLSVPFPSSAPNPSASSQLQVFAAQPVLLDWVYSLASRDSSYFTNSSFSSYSHPSSLLR
ncbi:Protein AF-10 [Acipenser ruthenus]|uniref:Protein AF-10 n=1 Tax=Acipenser ruthenus TaxID=7906 RepID=A0A444U3A6_ACIRT|nr:Protein AF-10 [Acipenser ruthenus]